MDEFACWRVSTDELSSEVQAGLRRAFQIARDRRSGTIEVDDVALALLAMRARLGIAWVGDWPVDIAAQIARLPRDCATQAPEPSHAARSMLQHAREQSHMEGETVLPWEYLVAACGEESSRVVGEYYTCNPRQQTWRAAVAWSFRARQASNDPAPDQVLTLQNAAELLSVHVQTLREYIRQGRLRAYRIAGERSVRVLRRDVLGLLKSL